MQIIRWVLFQGLAALVVDIRRHCLMQQAVSAHQHLAYVMQGSSGQSTAANSFSQ
jgi:hypothetical protein